MGGRALIIFIKNPEPGKVKTRLAADIGDEKALQLYRRLMHHTKEISRAARADKLLFYSSFVSVDDDWPQNEFQKKLQKGVDLGGRMKNAFEFAFEQGYEKACIIGSDCFQLDENIIDQSFDELSSYDLVIGPANDGGYYLLGMKKLYQNLFEDKQWSTDRVFDEAMAEADKQGLKIKVLPELIDVDYLEDAKASGLIN